MSYKIFTNYLIPENYLPKPLNGIALEIGRKSYRGGYV